MKQLEVYWFYAEYDFYPECWLLPQETKILLQHHEEARREGKRQWYILKPDGGSQVGRDGGGGGGGGGSSDIQHISSFPNPTHISDYYLQSCASAICYYG